MWRFHRSTKDQNRDHKTRDRSLKQVPKTSGIKYQDNDGWIWKQALKLDLDFGEQTWWKNQWEWKNKIEKVEGTDGQAWKGNERADLGL